MKKIRLLVELRPTARQVLGALEAMSAPDADLDKSGLPALPHLDLDPGFAAAPLPGRAFGDMAAASKAAKAVGSLLRSTLENHKENTVVVRGEIDEKHLADFEKDAASNPKVAGVFADVAVSSFAVCPHGPVGNDADVERLLQLERFRAAGMDGSGVTVAIVDSGINMAHLNSRGKHPVFDAARSWVPRAGLVPGELPVGHGTMCAFDACIAAPNCTLLDIALLESRRQGGSVMEGFLSDAVRAFNHLLGILTDPAQPGENPSLVVNNSWGMFHESWDYPVGHPGNYSDNPNHPFNRIVGTLERAGADILFAAGNCGAECPDSRCQGATDAGIFGANSHPDVLSVAGVVIDKVRIGYSSQGPGRLERHKPDLAGYTHFRGSGVYAADGGTSAACPVVAGVVAAVRGKRPLDLSSPGATPASIRSLMISTAEDLGDAGYDFDHGHGVVNGVAIVDTVAPEPAPPLPGPRPPFPWPFPLPPALCRLLPWLCERPFPPFPPRVPRPPSPPAQPHQFGQGTVPGHADEPELDPLWAAYAAGYQDGMQAAGGSAGDAHANDKTTRGSGRGCCGH